MPERPLWMLGAQELTHAYRARELSPVKVLDAILDRAEQINPMINAIVTFDREGARATAMESAQRWRTGQALGPFDGVPLTVKDSIPVKGLPTTWGSRIFADNIATEDELPVARLRAQGAVIIGKTNCPEFTLQGYTDNLLFGTTRNPWDTRLTPGGSSGGAVAAVASGLGPVALATDGGGSIRRPASHTGLVGFKPSTGRVARTGGLPVILHDLEVIGPIARTTSDAALLLSAIAGPDPRDRASLSFAQPLVQIDNELSPQRILFVPRFGDSPVDPEIAASVAAVAANLERLGHAVEEGAAPFELALLDRIWSVIGPAGLAWLLRSCADTRDRIGAPLIQMAAHGAALTAVDYVDALDKISEAPRRLDGILPALRHDPHPDRGGASLARSGDSSRHHRRHAGRPARTRRVHVACERGRHSGHQSPMRPILRRSADRLSAHRQLRRRRTFAATRRSV